MLIKLTCLPDGAGFSCFCTDSGFQGDRCDEGISYITEVIAAEWAGGYVFYEPQKLILTIIPRATKLYYIYIYFINYLFSKEVRFF